MAQPQMTDNQKHCANVARLLSATFPESDPDVLTPPPPRGTEEPPSSFVEAQELRGVVRRSFDRVGPDEAVKLAEQHAPEGLKELYKAAGGEDEYRKALVEPPKVRGVAPPRLTLEGYVGAGGGRDLKVHSACEVRGAGGSWRGGVVEAVVHVDGNFDWDESTFTVELLDGDQMQNVRGGNIRAPQKLVERTLPTGLEGFGERDFDARSPVGRAVALRTVQPEARADATLSADAGRRRARAENLRTFGEDEDRDASMDDVDRGADPASLNLSSTRRGRGHAVDAAARASRAARLERDGFVHTDPLRGATAAPADVLDDAAAPTETALTTEADGDAMKIDAPPAAARACALPDATAPPLLGHGPATESAPPTTIRSGEGGPDAAMADAPAERRVLPDAAPLPAPVAAPETTAAASEPAPPTTTDSVGGDGDATMTPAVSWRDLARQYQVIATGANLRKKRKKKDQDIFNDAATRQDETATSLVARVFDAASNTGDLYKSLAKDLADAGPKLEDKKKAIFAALEGVSAADFLAVARAPEPEAAAPAPAPPRSTPKQAWEPYATEMLGKVQPLAPAEVVPILTEYGFTVTSLSKKLSVSNVASLPEGWPCVVDVIGTNFGNAHYQDVITSKTRLLAYLEEALKQARGGTSFRLESVRKADDAAAALAGPTLSEKMQAAAAQSGAVRRENAEADVNWWHDLADEDWRHRLYRDMRDKGIVIIGDDSVEPFQLLSPSGNQPPKRPAGFYGGPLAPDVDYRGDMTEDKCTTAEQKAAWRQAKRVCEILNGVRDRRGGVVVPGVYEEEYRAWKDMGGDDSVVGLREERQNYSERGLYTRAIRDAINALRRDDPPRFSKMALSALRCMIVRSERHLKALAKHAGVDKEDLIRTNSQGQEYLVSGFGPCRLPGPLFGLMRSLHVEHVNIGWDGETATFLLGLRGLEDWKFNIAEPHVAFVTETLWMRAFVDGYLDNGALCFSKDDAERELFQFYMDPISTAERREFLALPSDQRSKKELNFLKETVMAGVVNPQTDEDRRRGAILHARHACLSLPGSYGEGAVAVSCVPERKKEIGELYDATVLRRRDDGTFDVQFDCGYVARGVVSTDLNMPKYTGGSLSALAGKKCKACYRGTKLDLDHVGLGWRWEPVEPSEEYPDGLMWYRILGIRDLLDYDINQNLSGYEWAKNLDLLDYFANYYKNALCEVGGYGIAAKDWVFPWTPALGWAYGSRY